MGRKGREGRGTRVGEGRGGGEEGKGREGRAPPPIFIASPVPVF